MKKYWFLHHSAAAFKVRDEYAYAYAYAMRDETFSFIFGGLKCNDGEVEAQRLVERREMREIESQCHRPPILVPILIILANINVILLRRDQSSLTKDRFIYVLQHDSRGEFYPTTRSRWWKMPRQIYDTGIRRCFAPSETKVRLWKFNECEKCVEYNVDGYTLGLCD